MLVEARRESGWASTSIYQHLYVFTGSATMAIAIKLEPVPLRVDSKGTIRVGGSRVTLDRVMAAYFDGASAEAIAEMYDTLDLGDIYSIIGYYLHHKDEVEQYLREREKYAAEVWARIEARQGSQAGLRERLLSRLDSKNKL